MNKRSLVTSLFCLLLFSTDIYAEGFSSTGSFNVSIGGGNVPGRTQRGSDPVSANISENVSTQCSEEETMNSDHISLSMLKQLMINGDDFNVSKENDLLHKINIPSLVTGGCLDSLKIDPVSVESGLGIAFRLPPKEFTIVRDGKEGKKVFHGLDQIKHCFKEKGLMNESGSFNRSKVTREHIKSFSYDVDVQEFNDNSLDVKKLYFISPDLDPARMSPEHPYAGVKILDGNFNKCFSVESLDAEEHVIYQNKNISEAYAACSSNDLKKMLKAYEDLGPSVVGNAAGAFKLARKALEIAMQDQLDENKTSIMKELRSFKNDELKNAYRDLKNNKLEVEDAQSVIEDYSKLLRKLDSEVFNPAKNEIETLLAERKNATDSRKKSIDKRIKKLNGIIAEFSKGRTKYGAETALKIAKKFALIDEGARDIEGFSLKSKYWGKLGVNRKQISMKSATKKIKSALVKFDEVALGWERDYEDYSDANDGDFSPARNASRKASGYAREKQRTHQRYQKQERKYASYCEQGMFGLKNPTRCRRSMSAKAVDKRRKKYLRKRAGYVRKEAYYSGRGEYYGQIAEDTRRRERDEDRFGDDDYFDDDFGFSDRDDDFYFDENPYRDDGYASYSYNDDGYDNYDSYSQHDRGYYDDRYSSRNGPGPRYDLNGGNRQPSNNQRRDPMFQQQQPMFQQQEPMFQQLQQPQFPMMQQQFSQPRF